MKLRLILIALMALLAFNASETSLADNNTRTSGNTQPAPVISKTDVHL